jgi:hypothetical protein
VPVQAIDYIKDPTAAYAGMTEVIRQKLLAGTPLFGLENETEISKRLGVVPRRIADVLKVSEAARLAHNAAVNFLRQRRYVYASQILHSSTAITPAIIAQTVLDRMNGVLDPENRVNGAVQLSLANVSLPVKGIGKQSLTKTTADDIAYETGGTSRTYDNYLAMSQGTAGHQGLLETDAAGYPMVFADGSGITAGGVSLTDFYNAEKQDRLIRYMRSVIDANPELGEEQVVRWASEMQLETDRIPFVVAERSTIVSQDYAEAVDGTSLLADVARSKLMAQIGFDAVIPKTELGGIVITFVSVKPDEVLDAQPHPILSDNWGLINHIADELKIDPVPVTMRELDADVATVNETTVAMYTGYNQLKRLYINYGLNRHLDPLTIEDKTALWQYAIPPSVTPENILYPDSLDHAPFADTLAEVARYQVMSTAAITTPLRFGPTPLEEVAIVETEELFGPGV